MRPSELGRLRLEREKSEKERREREAKKNIKEVKIIPPPVIKPSIVGKLVQETQRRKEEQNEEMNMRLQVREEAINEINKNITPFIENSLDILEEEALRFSILADERNMKGVLDSLETFKEELLRIKEKLDQFHSKLMSVKERTGRAEDMGWVIKDTFNPSFIKKRVRDNMDLLKGAADAILDIDLSIPGARRPVRLLQSIFDIGTDSFGFDKHEIVIEMDVSRDEDFAKSLAKELSSSRSSRFTPIGEPNFLSPLRRDLSLTPSRKSLDLSAAKKIVIAHNKLDYDTLRAILEAQGFPTNVIKEALSLHKELIPTKIRHKRKLPPSFGVKAKSVEKPLRESRLPVPPPEVNLDELKVQDLISIAKENGLKEYQRKKKFALIRYLQENLDNATLAAAVRRKQFNLQYIKIPIIFPG